MARVAGHALLRRHWILVGRLLLLLLLLLLLEILLVVESGLGSHVRGSHAAVAGHAAGLGSGNLGMRVLGGVNGVLAVDAVGIA